MISRQLVLVSTILRYWLINRNDRRLTRDMSVVNLPVKQLTVN